MAESLIITSAMTDWSSPSPGELRVTVLLAVCTLVYLAYHLAITPAVAERLFPGRAGESARRTLVSFFRKGVGAVLFGVLPLIAMALAWPGGLAACGLTLAQADTSLLFAAAFVGIMVPLLALQSRKPSFRAHYPEVRVPFTPRVATWNALAWAAYLFGYELFFRGVLVLALGSEIGALPALAVSLMGYVFVHLDRYVGETLGTLVSGTLFGLIALETGSLLAPFVAHLGVALVADHFAAQRAPAPAPS